MQKTTTYLYSQNGRILSNGGGGTEYSAGDNIDITNHVISVTGIKTLSVDDTSMSATETDTGIAIGVKDSYVQSVATVSAASPLSGDGSSASPIGLTSLAQPSTSSYETSGNYNVNNVIKYVNPTTDGYGRLTKLNYVVVREKEQTCPIFKAPTISAAPSACWVPLFSGDGTYYNYELSFVDFEVLGIDPSMNAEYRLYQGGWYEGTQSTDAWQLQTKTSSEVNYFTDFQFQKQYYSQKVHYEVWGKLNPSATWTNYPASPFVSGYLGAFPGAVVLKDYKSICYQGTGKQNNSKWEIIPWPDRYEEPLTANVEASATFHVGD